MADNRTTSMRHVGMSREAAKEAVLTKLAIGQQYRLKSSHKDPEEKGGFARCKLTDLSRNFAVFEHKDGTKETFTYQEIYRMMMDEEII